MKIGPANPSFGAPHTLQYEPEDLAALPELPPRYEWCTLQMEPAIRRIVDDDGYKDLIMWMTPKERTELITPCDVYVKQEFLLDESYEYIIQHESRDAVHAYMALLCWLGEVK